MTPTALKQARQALQMKNQAELAAALGIHKVTVAKMEAGMLAIDRRTALAGECLLRRKDHPTSIP